MNVYARNARFLGAGAIPRDVVKRPAYVDDVEMSVWPSGYLGVVVNVWVGIRIGVSNIQYSDDDYERIFLIVLIDSLWDTTLYATGRTKGYCQEKDGLFLVFCGALKHKTVVARGSSARMREEGLSFEPELTNTQTTTQLPPLDPPPLAGAGRTELESFESFGIIVSASSCCSEALLEKTKLTMEKRSMRPSSLFVGGLGERMELGSQSSLGQPFYTYGCRGRSKQIVQIGHNAVRHELAILRIHPPKFEERLEISGWVVEPVAIDYIQHQRPNSSIFPASPHRD
ncbi:hypothetical protein DL93DRAFT_2099554 [Clavulina sp. PMI_390]|nr:hypothetical protein DL93DRAFT_2099554 [Clavulina sp. PMI_390]